MLVPMTVNGEKEVADVFVALQGLVVELAAGKGVIAATMDNLKSAIQAAGEVPAAVNDVKVDPQGSAVAAVLGAYSIVQALFPQKSA